MTLKKTLKWIALSVLVLVAALFATTSIWPAINDVRTGATPEYPDLQAQHFRQPAEKVFDAALAVATASGWEITARNRRAGNNDKDNAGEIAGEIRAVATTTLWRFKDDVTITIGHEANGAVVNVRSRSRIGKGDLGSNARRIRRFQADLALRLPG